MAALSGTIAAIRRRRRRKFSGALNALALAGTSFLREKERLGDRRDEKAGREEDREIRLRSLELQERGLDEQAANRQAANERHAAGLEKDRILEKGRNDRAAITDENDDLSRDQRAAELAQRDKEFTFSAENPKPRKLTQKQQEAEDWIEALRTDNLNPAALAVLTDVMVKHNLTEKRKIAGLGGGELTTKDLGRLGMGFLRDFNRALEEINAPRGAIEDVRFTTDAINLVSRSLDGGLASPVFGGEGDLSNEQLINTQR